MKRERAWMLAVALLAAWTGSPLRAQEAVPANSDPQILLYESPSTDGSSQQSNEKPDPFAPGSMSCEILSGYYARAHVETHGPALNYLPEAIRLGVMVDPPYADCTPVKGRCELLLEVNESDIVTSYGSFLAGPNAIVRYNFLCSQAVVPYIQGGAGFVLNDAWHDRSQGQIGEFFEFLLRAEVELGKLSDDLTLNIEGGFQHISNAGMASRNGGINDVGVAIGLTWFFRN